MPGQIMHIGPEFPDSVWRERAKQHPGDCTECGAQCAPQCGEHPLGCIFGGIMGYWLIAEGCTLDHGED